MSKNNLWIEKAIELDRQGVSWREIARRLDIPRSTVSDNLRVLQKNKGSAKQVHTPVFTVERDSLDNSRILVISDLHMPYQHPKAFEFLQYLKAKYNPTRVICMGDELDKHALSFHDSDPDLFSAGHELEVALPLVKQLNTMFPQMDILESNHGSLVYRKAKHHGVPKQYLKSYNEVLEVDEHWKWHYELTITLPDGNMCYFHHGKSSDVLTLSQQMGMCAVQGHYHNDLAAKYWANPNGLFWAMQVGCLIDQESLAFSYNNVNIKRPLIGTGLIIDSKPVLEPMFL